MPIEYNAAVWTDAQDGNGGSPPSPKLTGLGEMFPKDYLKSKGIVIRDWTSESTADPIETTMFGSDRRSFVVRSQTELRVVFMHTGGKVPDNTPLETFNRGMLRKLNVTCGVGRATQYDCVIVGGSLDQVVGYFRDMICAIFRSAVKRMPSVVDMLEL